MKQKNKHIQKEFPNERLKRLKLSDTVQTRIVPDKKNVYTRKKKHKGEI